MNIAFYFDPSCPFCWITSRWLLIVAEHREISVDWKPFSLALKNDELKGGDDKTPHGDMHRASHRILRVIQAAHENHDASLIDLYSDFGNAFHIDTQPFDDMMIKTILENHSLPAELLQAADDAQYDEALQSSISSATKIAGEDIGVPTIIFDQPDGSKTGYFGPVLQKLPESNESLAIWDGLSKLATVSSFYELKRSRPDGGPDTGSTTK